MTQSQPSSDAVLSALRACRDVVLQADDRVEPCKYVLDDDTGRPVLCVPSAVLTADTHVLFIPDESPDALQLLTIPEPIEDGASACCDRWRAYFGDPPHAKFVRFAIDCARVGPIVFDGDHLTFPNDLRRTVGALCTRFNSRRHAFIALCRAAGADTPEPALLVGVDAFGFDVKTKFKVLRFEFGARAADAQDAAARIDLMLTTHEQSP